MWLGVVALIVMGLRSPWAWLLLLWSTAHGLEHTYLLLRYLELARELGLLGIDGGGAAQSLPGVFGRDGWLSLQSWCGNIPGFTTATRVTVHFVWNAGETSLLWAAGLAGLGPLLSLGDRRAPSIGAGAAKRIGR